MVEREEIWTVWPYFIMVFMLWLGQFILGISAFTHSEIMYVHPDDRWMYEEWRYNNINVSVFGELVFKASYYEILFPLFNTDYWKYNNFDNWAERIYGEDALSKSEGDG